MSKTKFNKQHKRNITINGIKYYIKHLTKKQSEYPQNNPPCSLCDCKHSKNCLNKLDSSTLLTTCLKTIPLDSYLKKFKKQKVRHHEQKRNI